MTGMTEHSHWRQILETWTILVINSLLCCVSLQPMEHACKGVLCYNGGRFEYYDGLCVCRCPTGFFGLICEIELIESAWPDGPYALLMPRSGCPEMANRGWGHGYVHFSMVSPLTIDRHSVFVSKDGRAGENTIASESGSLLEGPFSSAFVRLNFCFMQKMNGRVSDPYWPDGNYSIFGTADGCPEGFIEETVTINLPTIRSWTKDGFIPYMKINTTTGDLVVKLCRRTSDSALSNYRDKLGTFVVLKISDTDCDAGNNVYDVIEETLEFENTNEDQMDGNSNNTISFCHFWNPTRYDLQPCGDDKHHCGRGHCIPLPKLCDGTVHCLDGSDESDDGCAKKCSLAEFHCGKGVCILTNVVCDGNDDCPDGRDELSYNCRYKCSGGDWYCDGFCTPDRFMCDGYEDCWEGTDEDPNNCPTETVCSPDELQCYEHQCVIADTCNDTLYCSVEHETDTEIFCEGRDLVDFFYCGFDQCISTIEVCDGTIQCSDGRDELRANCYKRCSSAGGGNYYCHQDGCLSHQRACRELSDCGETTNTHVPLECLDNLGLTDGTIKDFQISASSSNIGHGPPMVRSTLNSWCPKDDDLDPFVQIDFYTPTLVEGLIVYNRMYVRGVINDNEYIETITPLGIRSFSVAYAMFLEDFKFYMEQPFQIDFALNYSEPHTFRFLQPFLARSIKILTLSPIQGGRLCLRLEVLGCRGKGHLTLDCNSDTDEFWIQFPMLSPSSLPEYLFGIQSLEDCKEACKMQFDRCTAVDFILNQWCRVYEREKVARYSGIITEASMNMHLHVCLTGGDSDFIPTDDGAHYNVIEASRPGEIASLGYPFYYQSNMIYVWKITSDDGLKVRITFVDIALHQSMTGEGCDVISVMQPKGRNYIFDSSYNGRTPTVPTKAMNATVLFHTCPRYSQGSDHDRGFMALFQFDHIAGQMEFDIDIIPSVLYSASLLGIDMRDKVMRRGQYQAADLTFVYFNVPCRDGAGVQVRERTVWRCEDDCFEQFTFLIDEKDYCNRRRPRKHMRVALLTIEYTFKGNLTKFSPEGFSAVISPLPSEEYEGPKVLIHAGEKQFTGRDFYFCFSDGALLQPEHVCDGIKHCAEGSDETACEFIYTEPVYVDVSGKSLEGMKICSEELQKCFVYFNLASRNTWNEDNSVCYTGGYTLPCIHRRSEMEFIRKWMQTYYQYTVGNFSLKPGDIFYTYIGLLRYKSVGGLDQIWQDGSKVSFTAWDKNQPADGLLNQCTEMVLGLFSERMLWRSVPCDEVIADTYRFFGTICERKLTTAIEGSSSTIIDTINGPLSITPREITNKLHHCTSGERIFRLAVCDGLRDCADGSDEIACDTRRSDECTSEEFRCTDGECVHLDKVCDHKADCAPDGNDEFCTFPQCETGEFRCFNQRCIPLSGRCDSFVDCEDESDEIECSTCNTNTSFRCEDLTCIHKSKICDNYVNCLDGGDERNCDQPFTSCYELWISGYMKNATIENNGQDTIECEFYLNNSGILRIVTTVEIDTTWSNDEGTYPMIMVETDKLRMHGNICTQKIRQSCLESEKYMAMFYDPHLNESFRHCIETTTIITINSSDSCANVTYVYDGPQVDGNEPFDVIFYSCQMYAVSPNSLAGGGKNISVGFVICETEHPITDDQIGCEDGTVAPIRQRCLYDRARGGHTEGCRNFKHLEECESFRCPAEYVKCPGSFCLQRSFLCDGDRQCPGGEDELGCWCDDGNTSLAILYHGTASEITRPYIFRLARQFYSTNRKLKIVSYTIQEHIPRLYHLESRQIHPFLERLNMITLAECEANDANMAEKIVSILGNDSYIHVIVIEDTVDATLLQPTIFANDPNIVHVYRVRTTERMKQHAVQIEHESDNVTLIKLDRWDIVSFNGARLFPDTCNGDFSRECKGQYRCSSSMICLPLHNVCDGNSQCPFGDDEELCDFKCPNKCSCDRYIADCKDANFTGMDIDHISNTARAIDMSNNVLSQSGVFSLPKTFPRIVRFIASNCEIRFISDYTFIRTRHLIYLDLSYNKIIHIKNSTFDGLVFLRQLILKGNHEIEIIDPKAFHSLHKITHLAITGTRLFEIQLNTFAGLNIDELDVSDNRISQVHNFAFNDLVAGVIKLDGNDINNFESDIFAGLRVIQRLEAPAFKFCCYKPPSLPEDNCYPHKDDFSSCEDLMRNSVLQTLLWIVCVLALVGNLCAITYRTLFDTARLKTGFGMFVTNLAVSDFLMGVYMMIIAIADLAFRKRYITMEDYWRNSGWCTFAGILATVSSEASVFFLCLITVDRILVIKYPFGQFRFDKNKAVFAVLVSWTFSWVLALLPVLHTAYFQGSFYSTTGVCLALPLTRRRPPGWLYSFMVFVILNFVAFIMIAIGQVLIYLEIRKNSQRMKKVTTTRRKDLTIARNLLLVLTTDFICWFPVGVMGILAIEGYEIPGEVYAWTAVFILPINSALNPFLYTLSAVVAKKTFNPRIDEQIKPAATSGTSKRIMKLWNTGAIVALEPSGYISLADRMKGPMKTGDLRMILHAGIKCMSYLHKIGYIHGDLKDTCFFMHPREKRKVAILGFPSLAKTKNQQTKDINDFGFIVRALLLSVKKT